MTPNWTETLNSDKYSAGTKDLPLGLKFWSILLYDHFFLRCKVVQKLKLHRITPNWIWHLTGKSALYTLNTYPWGPHFGPFRSTISHCASYNMFKVDKIGNAPNVPTLNLNTYSQRYSMYIKCLPMRPKFGPFLSTISRFQDTTCSRSAKIGNAPTNPKLNLNT